MKTKALTPGVSIIIPTTCEKARKDSLHRAIDSVLSQSGTVELIIVVNGDRIDEELFNSLKQNVQLRILYQEQPSQQLAQKIGRQNVNHDLFCFLDDDDELLTDSIGRRETMLRGNPRLAAVVINGWEFSQHKNRRYFIQHEVQADPLKVLLTSNWLASCGALFRAEVVDESYFSQPFYEWTYVAFRLCLQGQVGFIDHDGFHVYSDTPDSLSKSDAYFNYYTQFIEYLLKHEMPGNAMKLLKDKLSRGYNTKADSHLIKRQWMAAWGCHLKSLIHGNGLRYLPYTGKLLLAFFVV